MILAVWRFSSPRSCSIPATLLCGNRLDKLERHPIGGHERLIPGNVFWDFGLALGPVVKAGKIPDEGRFTLGLGGTIKRQMWCPPFLMGDHSTLERVPFEMQMALRFGIFGGGVIHREPFLIGTQVQIMPLEFQRAVGIAQHKSPLHAE